MKKVIIALLFFMTCTIYGHAQTEVTITEEIRSMSRGSQNALVMKLPGNSTKIVRAEWESFMRGYKGKTAYDKNNDEVFSDDVIVKGMSENTIDIYAKVLAKDADNVELIVWYNLGVTYLASNTFAEGISPAHEMLKEFSKKILIELLKEQAIAKESQLRVMNQELKSLEKIQSKYDKKISGYEKGIKKIDKKCEKSVEKIDKKMAVVNEDVAVNTTEQAKQKATIADQEKSIQNIKRDVEEMKKSKNR